MEEIKVLMSIDQISKDKSESLGLSSFHERRRGLEEEIHELFSEILTTRKLGKKSRKEITGVYHSLQIMGLISPKLEEEDEEWVEDFEEIFSEAREFKSAEKKTQKNTDDDYTEEEGEEPDFGSGEPKSNKSGEMRKTFLKLASLFHPDKANDPETELYHPGSNERSESGY